MKDDFFDWLEECPVQWFLRDDNSDGRTYHFVDNEDEEEEFKCVECGNIDFEFKDFSSKTIKICNQCKTEYHKN